MPQQYDPRRSRGGGRSFVSRRRFLATAGAGAAAGIVGCSSLPGVGGAEALWPEGGPPYRYEWEVTFADRFDHGELDQDRWSVGVGSERNPCPTYAGPVHCWEADHVRVDAEADRLVLRASADAPDGDARYTSGAVSTDGRLVQEFGFFEAKVRMPAVPGTLSSFRLFSDAPFRLVSLESRGVDAGAELYLRLYVEGDSGEQLVAGAEPIHDKFFVPLDEGFHVLGIEWRRDVLGFYVDGEHVAASYRSDLLEPLSGATLYPVLSLGVWEEEWTGRPRSQDFPVSYDVEWVRAWQHEDAGEWR